MVVLKRSWGEHFQLRKDQLQQLLPSYSYKWRAVQRTDLAKLFRSKGRVRSRQLGASFGDKTKTTFGMAWLAIYNGKTLSIGCQYFDAKETTKIRRWALWEGKNG